MHKAYDNGQYRLYVSSKKAGSITIKYQGDCVFKLPYNLEPKKIYELVLGMETATLNILSTPDNAMIYIDNERVGTGFVSKAVSIGAEHRYKVECGNYYPKEDVVLFSSSEKIELIVNLEPAFGFVTVKTTPSGADVYVDDKLVGKTPYLSEIISRGMHKITVNKQGYETAVKRLNINLNEEQNVEFELVEGESSMPVQQVVVQQPVPTGVNSSSGFNCSSGFNSSSGSSSSVSENKTFTVKGVTFEMVLVKGGTFTMGATSEQSSDAESDEEPTHSVTLSDYYIGKFEVTQELWYAVMGTKPTYNGGWTSEYGMGNHYPAYRVSWNDCQDFIRRLNELTGANFRLPTEAEWEYAARGGNKSKGYKYSGSNNIGDVAWYWKNSGSKTHQVGTKSSNELGIYDMSGNVYEWCQDWYGSGSQTNPEGASSGSYRVLRGGSWYFNARS